MPVGLALFDDDAGVYKMKEKAMVYADDLQQIHGIGPGIQKRLMAAGVTKCSQLASLTPAQIYPFIQDMIGMSVERIEEQDWIGQAQNLSASLNQQAEDLDRAVDPGRSRYAMFTVELLLDEDNMARRTRVVNVQDKSERSWAGWDAGHLAMFITRSAELNFPEPLEVSRESAPDRVSRQTAPTQRKSLSSGRVTGTDVIKISLQEIAVEASGGGVSGRLIQRQQPFSVQIALGLESTSALPEMPLNYLALVYAKNLSGTYRQVIGRGEGAISPAESTDLDIECSPLEPGVYRLEAFVELFPPSRSGEGESEIAAMTEAGVYQVY